MPHSTKDSSQTKEYIATLSSKGLIQLTGEEKVKYLQGQVTADINKLSESAALLACHCDFKGKAWSVFYTFAWQDSILLVTHNSVLEKSLSELNKYGVFAKVDIVNQSQEWQIIGGTGQVFEKAITDLFTELPVGENKVISNEHGLVMSLAHPTQRYLVLQPAKAEKQIACQLSNEDNLWEIDDIQSGLGDIRDTTSNEYVPQMLNLQMLNAIDFEKGCYMGQEVVARTKYLGRNKRAGFILQGDSDKQDLSGEQLEYQIGENWRPGGKILRCAADPAQTWIFAVLANDTEIGSSFRLKSSPDKIFITQALPYALQ